MIKATTQKGPRGEKELERLLSRIGGVSVRRQPSSGAFGTRINTRSLQGDLKLNFGETTYRCEVKRRKEAPQVLERWLLGLDLLAIRSDQGDWRFYLPEAAFLNLLALAAEAASTPESPMENVVAPLKKTISNSFRRKSGGSRSRSHG